MIVYLNVVLRGIEVFVDLSQPAVHVPQEDHTQGGRSAQHPCGHSHHLYWLGSQKGETSI